MPEVSLSSTSYREWVKNNIISDTKLPSHIRVMHEGALMSGLCYVSFVWISQDDWDNNIYSQRYICTLKPWIGIVI